MGVNELLEAAEIAGIIGLVGYCLRFDPGAGKFKEMLDNDLTGQLLHVQVECGSYLPDWRPGQDYRQTVSALKELGGGALLELSHELDYIYWFFGDITSVYAYLHNSGTLRIDVEESADLILTNHEGLPISMHLDFNSRHAKRCCTVHGTNGKLTWDAIKKQVIWCREDTNPIFEFFEDDSDHKYREQLQHFLDCIENNNSPAVTLKDSTVALRLVEAAKKSHETGKNIVLG
jgi:predicted dehydrogenase